MDGSTTAPAPPQTRRFTVSEYHRMAEAGILGEDDPVELINGQIYVMTPIGSQHAACVDRLTRLFVLAFHDQATVRVQNPILLGPDSEPEPDVSLLAPRDDAYAARHPRPEEVMLIVEVAGSSLAFDQKTKLPLYAQAGIPEVWIVALDEDQIHIYREPTASGYAAHTTHERGDTITVQPLPDAETFAVKDILGT
jgi:Uma2 family endonuclease